MKTPKLIPHLTGFLVTKGAVCANCRFRKEKYAVPPADCTDCGWLAQRNTPYFGLLPVWEENYEPTERENTAAFRLADSLKAFPCDRLPDYCVKEETTW